MNWPEAIELAFSERWDGLVRLVRGPGGRDKAREKNEYEHLPLHYSMFAVKNKAPVAVVELLLAAYPEGAREKDFDANLPLHLAAANNAPVAVVELLLAAYPEGAREKDFGGNLPLHLAVANNAPVAVVELLLEVYPEAVRVSGNGSKTPLVYAGKRKANREVVLLLKRYTKISDEELRRSEARARWAREKQEREEREEQEREEREEQEREEREERERVVPGVIDLVYKKDWDALLRVVRGPEGGTKARERDWRGFLPLRLAVMFQAPAEVIRALVDAYPGATRERAGKPPRTPLEYARQRNVPVAVVTALLDTMTREEREREERERREREERERRERETRERREREERERRERVTRERREHEERERRERVTRERRLREERERRLRRLEALEAELAQRQTELDEREHRLTEQTRQHHSPEAHLQREHDAMTSSDEAQVRRFEYEDVHRATNGFANHTTLGAGGFGSVYAASPIPGVGGGADLAVKRIRDAEQFAAELNVLMSFRARHPHVLPLLGFTVRDRDYFLVLPRMVNGSLDVTLPNLDVHTRVRAVAETASALEYLHNPSLGHDVARPANSASAGGAAGARTWSKAR